MLNKDSEVPFGPFLIASMAIVFVFIDKFSNLIAFCFNKCIISLDLGVFI